MKVDRVTAKDLAWWLELAPTLDWIFAKTYAETAPHSYIVLGKTKQLTDQDYVRAGAVIRTFGAPGKFYDYTNIYLTSLDGSIKWWTMDAQVAETSLVNQAATDRVYGVQNAPSTYSGLGSVYDEIATQYDKLYSPVGGDEKTAILRLLADRVGAAPFTLDIGCGSCPEQSETTRTRPCERCRGSGAAAASPRSASPGACAEWRGAPDCSPRP